MLNIMKCINVIIMIQFNIKCLLLSGLRSLLILENVYKCNFKLIALLLLRT